MAAKNGHKSRLLSCVVIGLLSPCLLAKSAPSCPSPSSVKNMNCITNEKPKVHLPQKKKSKTASSPNTNKPNKTIHYEKVDPYTLNRQQIADVLGWMNDHSGLNRCRGYYVEPNLFYGEQSGLSITESPVNLTADYTSLALEDVTSIEGNVVITQPDRRITADKAYIYRDAKTNKFSTADLYGNVVLREPGKFAQGDKAHIELQSHGGVFDNVLYRITAVSTPPEIQTDVPREKKSTINIDSTVGWGIAKQFVRQPSGIIVVHQATYTTCPPPQHFWQVRAKTLTLDKEEGKGVARGALLYLKNMPVMYTPYFSFPLDDRRKSGFLFPDFGTSSRSGYLFGVPYYLNLAPNVDATVEPEIMSDRGVQFKGLFRYLTNKSHGNLHGTYLPDDSEFKDFKRSQEQKQINRLRQANPSLNTQSNQTIIRTNPLLRRLEDTGDERYFASLQDTRVYGTSGWSSHIWANVVSDDYYFNDFKGDPAQITDNQLINKAALFYGSQHWHFTSRVLGYQTLHPIDRTPVSNQYRRLPQLIVDGRYPAFYRSFNFNLDTEYNNFTYLDAPGQTSAMSPSIGSRTYIEPALSMHKYWVAGFLKPEVKLSSSFYNTSKMNVIFYNSQGNRVPGQQGGDESRVLPIADIDMGLFFDRDTHWFGHRYTQTLEPRLFYLYVPYKNQDDIPVFDTAVEPFSYSQLFRTNRFNGMDRVGDTSQLTFALSSRFLDGETGDEKFKAGIGEIFYFKKRRVNLNNVAGPVTLASVVPNDDYVSPIAGEMTFHINHAWRLESNIAWDPTKENNLQNVNPNSVPSDERLVNANVSLNYQRDNHHIFTVGYYYLRGGDPITNQQFQNSTAAIPTGKAPVASDSSLNNLSQGQIGGLWPLNQNWKGYASWRYDFSKDHAQTYFAGVEYDSCCWAVRVTGGRDFKYLTTTNTPVYDTTVYVEFALIGLGGIDISSPLHLLHDAFPNYYDHFGNVNYY